MNRLFIIAAVFALALTSCGGGGSSPPSIETMGGGESGEGMHAGESGEGSESGEGGGEEAATQYMQTDTADFVRNGARLVLSYDAATEMFTGTVENTTNATLSQVRVEVHLSNGVELGPTTPQDLAPGETIPVTLDATGQVFTTWGAHPEVGAQGGGNTVTAPQAFELLDGWAVMDGVPLGIEHEGYGLSAWFSSDGVPHISAAAPQHQPSVAATWSGAWLNALGQTGDMQVTVSLGNDTWADLLLSDVPGLGNLQWDDMPVSDGRFTGNTQGYETVGQFGGPGQIGVVGHASGPDLQSVFYGQRN